jgi:hypothetical protein
LFSSPRFARFLKKKKKSGKKFSAPKTAPLASLSFSSRHGAPWPLASGPWYQRAAEKIYLKKKRRNLFGLDFF